MQHDQSDCAAAVVSTVLLSYKKELSIMKIREIIGTVSYAFILATCGAATGYMSGFITGYNFGRILESNLGWD